MNRREFVFSAAAAAAAQGQTGKGQASSQMSFSLNRGWMFRRKESDPFERVNLPHSNVQLPWHSFDDNSFQFVSTYTRKFRALPAWRGKRVFVDFDGVMTAATVRINGHAFAEYKGGYTPFSLELTDHLKADAENTLEVRVDSTERADIPPFGGNIDYLTFGGIYRDVRLRVGPPTLIANVFAKPVKVLGPDRRVDVRTFVDGPLTGGTKDSPSI